MLIFKYKWLKKCRFLACITLHVQVYCEDPIMKFVRPWKRSDRFLWLKIVSFAHFFKL